MMPASLEQSRSKGVSDNMLHNCRRHEAQRIIPRSKLYLESVIMNTMQPLHVTCQVEISNKMCHALSGA